MVIAPPIRLLPSVLDNLVESEAFDVRFDLNPDRQVVGDLKGEFVARVVATGEKFDDMRVVEVEIQAPPAFLSLSAGGGVDRGAEAGQRMPKVSSTISRHSIPCAVSKVLRVPDFKIWAAAGEIDRGIGGKAGSRSRILRNQQLTLVIHRGHRILALPAITRPTSGSRSVR